MAKEAEGSKGGQQQAKNRDGKPKRGGENAFPVSVVHKDVYHRLNFMYQTNIFLENLGSQFFQSHSRKGKERGVDRVDCVEDNSPQQGIRDLNCSQLARHSMKSSFKTIAVHQTLRLDTSLKRSVCKACGTVLVPGMTAKIRVRPSRTHQQIIHTTCLSCSSVTSVPAPPFLEEQAADRGSASLDGPVRSKRRRKAQKKVPFNDREKRGGGVGHELWNDSGRVKGWGCTMEEGLPEPQKSVAKGETKFAPIQLKAAEVTPVVDMTDEEAMMNL